MFLGYFCSSNVAVSRHGRTFVLFSHLHCVIFTYSMAVATLVLSNDVTVTLFINTVTLASNTSSIVSSLNDSIMYVFYK